MLKIWPTKFNLIPADVWAGSGGLDRKKSTEWEMDHSRPEISSLKIGGGKFEQNAV
jgi:hypothetical protein